MADTAQVSPVVRCETYDYIGWRSPQCDAGHNCAADFHFGIVRSANARGLLSPLVHRVLSAACPRTLPDLK